MNYLSQSAILYYRWQNTWLSLRTIMANLALQDELVSLIRWADKKRLQKIKQGYIQRLQHLEERLLLYRMRHRGLVTLCEFLLTAYKQLKPVPKYYKSGSAAQYRLA